MTSLPHAITVIAVVLGLQLFARHGTKRFIAKGEKKQATVTDTGIVGDIGGRKLTYVFIDNSGEQITKILSVGRSKSRSALQALQKGDTLTVIHQKSRPSGSIPLSILEHTINTPFYKTRGFRSVLFLGLLIALKLIHQYKYLIS